MKFTTATIFATCATALALGACKQRFTNANLEVVNREFERADENRRGLKNEPTGVTPKEVESILGPPKRIETARLPLETQKKEVEVTRYFYQQDGETVELHFFDNKLIEKVPLLGSAKPSKDLP